MFIVLPLPDVPLLEVVVVLDAELVPDELLIVVPVLVPEVFKPPLEILPPELLDQVVPEFALFEVADCTVMVV
jgi:hypothetical protein